MKKILIANLAGGVGKTSIVHSIATAAAEYGKQALAIDADPAASLTYLCGIENPRFTARELFDGSERIEKVAVKVVDRFSLVPSASRLIHADFLSTDSKTSKDLMDQFESYDLVIFDSPTGPSPILTRLISLSDQVISPIDGSIHSVRGLLNLRDFVAKSSNRPRLRALENRPVEWDPELRANVVGDFNLLDHVIRNDISLSNSQLSTRSVLTELPHSEIAADFRELTYTLLEEIGLF